jgi:effector-binding domain-containing protein/DNA-binding HxlR family transcriptional regulator
MKEDLILNTLNENTEQITELLSALSHPIRLKILSILLNGQTEFRKIQEQTKLSKTALSHHLNILLKSEIIENPSRGNYVFNDDGKNILTNIIDSYSGTLWKKKREEQLRAEFITKAYERRHKKMELNVKIVELEPMRVTSFRAISETPEHDAAKMLTEWAKGKGYLNDIERHPIYGFNNPGPIKGEKEYGYEFWIKVDSEYTEDGISIKDVSGGKYAVTTCSNLSQIGELWMKLYNWVKENGYEIREAECLEKTMNIGASDNELVLELYEPIK